MYPDASDPKDRPQQQHPYCKKSAAAFNIISNLTNDNNSNNQSSQRSLDAVASSSSFNKRPTRDFNILTNKCVLALFSYRSSRTTKAATLNANRIWC